MKPKKSFSTVTQLLCQSYRYRRVFSFHTFIALLLPTTRASTISISFSGIIVVSLFSDRQFLLTVACYKVQCSHMGTCNWKVIKKNSLHNWLKIKICFKLSTSAQWWAEYTAYITLFAGSFKYDTERKLK